MGHGFVEAPLKSYQRHSRLTVQPLWTLFVALWSLKFAVTGRLRLHPCFDAVLLSGTNKKVEY